jgi:hypothetical protein
VIRYTLPERARVRIRVGLAASGPLLSTVIDWVPRAAGASEQAWDGRDASGVLDLSAHPKLALRVEAFSLPRNTLLVTPLADRAALIPDIPETARRRVVQVRRPKGMYDYARQPMEQHRDFPVSLRLPDDLPRTAGGVPIVTAPVRVRVDAAPEHARQLIEERFEAVYFVDGTFLFEHETSVLPVSFLWDPQGVSPGVHYLSTNLRGYEGHFGIATRMVEVAAPGAATSGARGSAGGGSQ